jgi:anti-sigma-K factor RskA
MSDASNVARSLRDRFSGTTEERLGRALSDLLENPLLTGALGRASDARERAAQAQEVAMGALNLPSAADIERLTRRLRSVSNRLEGIEDGVHRLDRALSPSRVEARLSAIEEQLATLTKSVEQSAKPDAPADRKSASKAKRKKT